jgi:DNA-binding transcriptional ArsR family regulator
MNASSTQPTLWRTCRVLASADRLRLFSALTRKQPQTVSSLAEQVVLSLPKTSMYLRAMESRGLLSVRRVGRRVEYQMPPANADSAMAELVSSLQNALNTDEKPIAKIYQLATGFTHPARIEVYRRLAMPSANMEMIAVAIKLSPRAVTRHVQKLAARGYVTDVTAHKRSYVVVKHPDAVGRALAELALR